MLANLRVHQRLREARLVSFVVTEAAIAPHVDHDVAVKRLTEFDRHLAGERHRLRIIAIHMENGSLHALRRSEEHTSELQSLMSISSAVFCLKKKKTVE